MVRSPLQRRSYYPLFVGSIVNQFSNVIEIAQMNSQLQAPAAGYKQWSQRLQIQLTSHYPHPLRGSNLSERTHMADAMHDAMYTHGRRNARRYARRYVHTWQTLCVHMADAMCTHGRRYARRYVHTWQTQCTTVCTHKAYAMHEYYLQCKHLGSDLQSALYCLKPHADCVPINY